MLLFTLLLLSSCVYIQGGLRQSRKPQKPLVQPIEDVIREKNLPLEVHDIVSDGYHITYHRIPGKGRPVLVMNGVLQSSATTVVNGRVYSLVSEGYDVWIGNYRGGMYGLRHDDPVNYSTKKRRFWEFTFEEMGNHDLRAALEYIARHTGGQRLIYVGFSMGTTVFWVLAASDPAYTAARVEAMIALGPVVRPKHCKYTRKKYDNFLRVLWQLGVNQILPYSESKSYRYYHLCTNSWMKRTCRYVVRKFIANMKAGFEFDGYMEQLQYYPGGVSLMVILHYDQIAQSGIFRQFDYGRAGNFNAYHKYSPPAYNLTAVNIPTYFAYSNRDEYAAKQDVEWLMDQLGRRPQVLLHERVNNFKHVDFNLNTNLQTLVDKPVTDLVRKITEAGGPVDIEEIK